MVVRVILFLALVVLLTGFCPLHKMQRFPDENCLQFKHTAVDTGDSLEMLNLVECQAPDGLSSWFSSDINKSVCSSKQCKMVSIRLFWDGVGNYHHFELINNEPLTKTDHTEFSAGDYEKLDLILSDSLSIFKDLDTNDLVVENKDNVDGVSGATSKSLRGYVVSDAAYTCYTLWHTVYGARRDKITELVNQRVSIDYLRKSFGRNDSAVDFWALNHIRNRPEYAPVFFNELLARVGSGHDHISDLALRTISIATLQNEKAQAELVRLLPKVNELKRLDIVWKLNDVPHVYDPVIILLLHFYQKEILTPTALSYVYRSISDQHVLNPDINKILIKLLADKNQYVRSITSTLLKQKN